MTPQFWSSVWARRNHIFLQWDFVVALLLGFVPVFGTDEKILDERIPLIFATVGGVSTGLLGVVIAGLALVLAFLNDDALLALAQREDSAESTIFPFSFTAVLAVATTAFAVLLLVATPEPGLGQRIAAGAALTLFIWTLLAMLSLVTLSYKYFKLRVAAIPPRADS